MRLTLIVHSDVMVLMWAGLAYVVHRKLRRWPLQCNCRREEHFTRGERGHPEVHEKAQTHSLALVQIAGRS
jgi:hypothetical protein